MQSRIFFITLVFSVTSLCDIVTFRNHYNLFDYQETDFLIIINVENKCLSGIIVYTKILSSNSFFYIDNNEKCFLSSKSEY